MSGSTVDYRKSQMKFDSIGPPMICIASAEETCLILNIYQTADISKVDFQGNIIWETQIPNLQDSELTVREIGYLSSGGYFVIAQETESGIEHLYKLDENGNWL
jgi:hypothetical protein